MTTTPAARSSFVDAFAVYLRPRVLIVMLLGFASGLPLALSGSTLAVWLTEANIDLATIGLFSLVGLPYTIKFLWAPLVDALDIPLLSRRFGRRRGWLIFSQLLLIAAIVLLGLCDPSVSIPLITLGAVTVATASATQDIVIDAFRVGMLVAGAGVLALVAWFEYRGIPHGLAWTWGYMVAALLMGVGLAATILAREPEGGERPPVKDAREVAHRVFATAYGAFEDFLTRPSAVAILLFVLLFKFCDAFAGVLTAPFVLKIGFDKETYAAIVKGVGFIAAILGGFAGGMIARALPLSTSLWIAGLLQMASNLVFSWQALIGANVAALTFTIVVENFTGAIGTVIFVAYLSALCGDRAHTATQYALLTALAAVGRTVLASGGGFVAEAAGWFLFFVITAASAIPSFLLLWWLQQRGHFTGLDRRS
jgi:MFS transporter, PAT family, beta-lactamase induction signal transducer AmpG